jgi:hypothetical protein
MEKYKSKFIEEESDEDIVKELQHFDGEHIYESLQKLELGEFFGYKVFSVNGDYVKLKYEMDFCEGSNSERYDFVPKNEIWIDNNINNRNYKYILGHEYTETELMKNKGLEYNAAHDIANKFEKKYREKN